MVRITIISIKDDNDDDGLPVYELPEGSSVGDLKAEIEETEGIDIGDQRLVHNELDLRDDEKLDLLIFDDPLNAVIRLLQVVDDKRCRAPAGIFGAAHVSLVQITPRSIHSETPQKLARAKYDWNGEIKHPTIRGLPLECHSSLYVSTISDTSPQPGWLYGSIHELKPKSKLSSIFHKGVNEGEGYVPKDFVSIVEENEDLEKIPPVPPLPPFQFPPATGMLFKVPFSDKGHSFFNIKANYELMTSPADPTHVTLSLLCSTFGTRRVSSISIFITVPQTELADVRICENEAHKKEIYTDKEVAEWSLEEKHSDGRLRMHTRGSVGYEGESSEHLIGSIGRGLNVARRKVEVSVLKEDSIFWNIKAPMTLLDEDGILGEESITFILTKKPVQFRYKCRVTHAKDGVEKTTERSSKA